MARLGFNRPQVTCYKNGNNNIRIVAIAVISGENKENWTWFLKNLREHVRPDFIISDQDKALLQHSFSLRHVLENFNVKFKNKRWKVKFGAVSPVKLLRDMPSNLCLLISLRINSGLR